MTLLFDTRTIAPLLLATLLLAGCASETEPLQPPERKGTLYETRADSVAGRLVDASGRDAWEALPGIAFTFAIERGGEVNPVARHLWDRRTNRYRVEWPAAAHPDSIYVGLFTDWPDEGDVFRGGIAIDSIRNQPAVQSARGRTINDTYWLLAPLKVFDPGVQRVFAADSLTAEHEVIELRFSDVGITPGDRYWLFVNRETGLLDRWTFLLQGREQPASYRWTGYETLQSPAGAVTLSTRKVAETGDAAILTHELRVVDQPEDGLFTDPRPRLAPAVAP